ncbi:hypothetical protein [Azospirillum formosense]|uniref:hypothetical protein n=1 Tax=Azospirillum formosense TaxID=861533 RepID=UPI001C91C715|nr:hypothetical protein [Azospirillum formosense]MBY3757692.1 hypothetical protein [Azospirillum formosense]
MPVPLGELRHDPGLGLPILDALAAGTPTLGEIEALPEMARHDFGTISRFVALLASANQAHPLAQPAEEGRRAAGRLNRAIARRMLVDESLVFLAAPTVGLGVGADVLERLVLAGLLTGQPMDVQPLGGFVADALRALGGAVFAEDGSPISDPEAMRPLVATKLAALLPQKLPLWQRLGLL